MKPPLEEHAYREGGRRAAPSVKTLTALAKAAMRTEVGPGSYCVGLYFETLADMHAGLDELREARALATAAPLPTAP